MDNNSIIDELFLRIQTLEEENKKLKTQVSNLEEELVKKEGENEDLSEGEPEVTKKDNMMIDDIVEVIQEVKPVSITYIPNDDPRKLYVMGDFTGWELLEMKKEVGNIFTYNSLLMTGFKYFYCFFAEDQPVVDFGNLFEENPTNGQIHNVIYLANQENKFEDYDHNSHKKVLEASRKHYYKKQIGDESDINIIEQCIAQSEQLKAKYEKLVSKKNDKVHRIKKAYE
jgi:hypothetical protein